MVELEERILYKMIGVLLFFLVGIIKKCMFIFDIFIYLFFFIRKINVIAVFFFIL